MAGIRDKLSRSQSKERGQPRRGCPLSPSARTIRHRLEGTMADTISTEEHTYQIGEMQFIVTPVYKKTGETMSDILLKLILAELEAS